MALGDSAWMGGWLHWLGEEVRLGESERGDGEKRNCLVHHPRHRRITTVIELATTTRRHPPAHCAHAHELVPRRASAAGCYKEVVAEGVEPSSSPSHGDTGRAGQHGCDLIFDRMRTAQPSATYWKGGDEKRARGPLLIDRFVCTDRNWLDMANKRGEEKFKA